MKLRRRIAGQLPTFRGLVAQAVYKFAPVLGYDVRRLGPGAVLVSRAVVLGKAWMQLDKGVFEYLAHMQIASLLKMYRVNCVIDVGAHKGQYAGRLRQAGYRGHIVSFEPVPSAFEELRRRAAGDPKWTVHQLALGREDGIGEMKVVPGTLSSLLPASKLGAGRYPKLQEPQRVDVEVRRLDGLLGEVTAHVRKPRLYLKLDTQGYDLEVLAGLGERTRHFVGMQSEVALLQIYSGMPRMCETLRVYEAAGFEISGLYPVSHQSRTGRALEYDCIMVRASALANPRKPTL
jgi:FkbM family methyltransferase